LGGANRLWPDEIKPRDFNRTKGGKGTARPPVPGEVVMDRRRQTGAGIWGAIAVLQFAWARGIWRSRRGISRTRLAPETSGHRTRKLV